MQIANEGDRQYPQYILRANGKEGDGNRRNMFFTNILNSVERIIINKFRIIINVINSSI